MLIINCSQHFLLVESTGENEKINLIVLIAMHYFVVDLGFYPQNITTGEVLLYPSVLINKVKKD